MNNVLLSLRKLLAKHFVINTLSVQSRQQSSDGTVKFAFKLHDGHLVEGVLIPTEEGRMTACVSSQVGCSLSCTFCATGYMDRKRNLDAGEIYDQVVSISREAEYNFDKSLSNIVFMGMGEPMLNDKNVMEGIDKITSPEGLNMASRRITVSYGRRGQND